jgi:hypothetical protein
MRHFSQDGDCRIIIVLSSSFRPSGSCVNPSRSTGCRDTIHRRFHCRRLGGNCPGERGRPIIGTQGTGRFWRRCWLRSRVDTNFYAIGRHASGARSEKVTPLQHRKRILPSKVLATFPRLLVCRFFFHTTAEGPLNRNVAASRWQTTSSLIGSLERFIREPEEIPMTYSFRDKGFVSFTVSSTRAIYSPEISIAGQDARNVIAERSIYQRRRPVTPTDTTTELENAKRQTVVRRATLCTLRVSLRPDRCCRTVERVPLD